MSDAKAGDHGHDQGHHAQTQDDHAAFVSGFFTDARRPARWLLVFNVILLALTAQLFRENYFGLFAPIPTSVQLPPATCSCPVPDTRCLVPDAGTEGKCTSEQVKVDPPTSATFCDFSGMFVPDDATNATGCTLAGFACVGGRCVSVSGSNVDPCFGVICNSPDSECQQPGSGTCVNGECVYRNVADGTFCGGGSGENETEAVYLGNRCQSGTCQPKTTSEVTSFAYDASISSGIVGSALAIEVLFSGVASPNLAAFAITTAVINMGWTGYSRDVGNFPHDNALNRAQNAFVFIAGGFAILWALSLLTKNRKEFQGPTAAIALVSIIISTVQFGLVAQLLSQHFTRTEDGAIDNDANIVFNWSYIATIYAAAVTLSIAISIFLSGTFSAGFAWFSLIVNLIALAWAAQHNDYGTLTGGDFTDSALAWQSFAFIAGSVSLVTNLVLVHNARSNNQGGKKAVKSHLFAALLLLVVFATLIGLVANVFDKHFFVPPSDRRGSNMLIVAARDTDNYGNVVSPFAWPISIWTSAVVCAFTLEALTVGAFTGLAALALAESANLLGWAANHVYFGSVVYERLEGDTRAWEGVALTASIFAIFFALIFLRPTDSLPDGGHAQAAAHQDDGVPAQSDFLNRNRGGTPAE